MKFCISNRQSMTLLKKADEIKIEQRDYKAIPEYMEKYPGKSLILELENVTPENFDWNTIKMYADAYEGDFYVAASNYLQMDVCRLSGIKFYYKYAVTNYFELKALKAYGVSYVLIGVPLIFDLKNVARYGIPIRAIPNLAYEPYLEHENGILGGWIRPEDTDKYGQYIAVFEFYAPKALEKEAVLFRVYAEQKRWPGNLNLLIEHLNVDFDNRLFYDEDNFAIRRMGCKQKCLSGKTCHYCEDQFNTRELLHKYREYKTLFDNK